MRLPKAQLTEPELAVLRKHVAEMTRLQGLLETRQEAVNDIVGLALEARGLSPTTHELRPDGSIIEKETRVVHPT